MKNKYLSLFCLFFALASCGAKKTEIPEEILTWLPSFYARLSYDCQNKSEENQSKLTDLKDRTNLFPHAPFQYFEAMGELRQKTGEITSFMATIRHNIAKNVGKGFDKDRLLKNPYQKEGLYEFMTDPKNGHGAEQLEKELKKYYAYTKSKNYTEFGENPLAPAPRGKTFASHYFGDKPIILVLIDLVEIENHILECEYQCLRHFTPRELLHNMRFYPMVSTETKKLRAGEDYKALLYLTQFPTWQDKAKTKMWVNDMLIKIDASGAGEVNFKATGKGKQRWEGKIVTQYLGKDTTFTVSAEYEVVE